MGNHGFWDVSVSNIVTWVILIVGLSVSQYLAVKILGHRMDNFETWCRLHDTEAKDRDKLIVVIEKAIVELSTLARVATNRLEMLEQRKSRSEER